MPDCNVPSSFLLSDSCDARPREGRGTKQQQLPTSLECNSLRLYFRLEEKIGYFFHFTFNEGSKSFQAITISIGKLLGLFGIRIIFCLSKNCMRKNDSQENTFLSLHKHIPNLILKSVKY